MNKLYKILGFIVFLGVLAVMGTFAFSFLLIGVITAGIVGLYRYYIVKRRYKNGKIGRTPKGYSSGEIIDMPVEDRSEERRKHV
ncbi:hypothetical protein [Desulfitobacterium sp.]|uniref:hypothetical protein n=1 Tax=Desulfitobacterium sp. TaxID=49981 RepID=UPI002B206393|nr:hypothetical protein [Desulfitobacterium sp.]MEA4902779.1 hypothetical protein [Desulfitobacterium sp.]